MKNPFSASHIISYSVAASIARRFLSIAGFGSGTSVSSSGEMKAMRKALDLAGVVMDKPMLFIDAGGHIGEWTQAALATFRHSKIHAFEPSMVHANAFEANFFPADRVTLTRAALGREAGSAVLFKDQNTTGLASMTKRDLSHHGIEMRIEEAIDVQTLDDYCANNNITHVDFLKIDVEGHELDVLAGASSLLKRGAISALQFEFGGCNIDTRTYFRDFYKLLEPLGFSIHVIRSNGDLARITRYREFLEQFTTTNYIAVKKR
jgi:FkbM family methyltransferase